MADALKSLTKAEKLGCSGENVGRLYHVFGVLCFEIGRYGEALTNLEKAEQIVGIDLDILQRKAVIYGINEDVENCILTANQIKLIAPSEYLGYQLAFDQVIQRGHLETAEKELDQARKYIAPSMDFCLDGMTPELEKYKTDKDREHLHTALAMVGKALETLKPTVTDVVECYICSAEIYLQMEEADRAIDCLNAAGNPAQAYNDGFATAGPEKPEYSPEQTDRINRLYLEAYTIRKDFENVMEYARKLQQSEEEENAYLGKYTEAKSMKELGLPDAEKKYAEIIKFFRHTLLKDPGDTRAKFFRVRCSIDTGSYDEAKRQCNFPVKETRDPLLEEIREAGAGKESGQSRLTDKVR